MSIATLLRTRVRAGASQSSSVARRRPVVEVAGADCGQCGIAIGQCACSGGPTKVMYVQGPPPTGAGSSVPNGGASGSLVADIAPGWDDCEPTKGCYARTWDKAGSDSWGGIIATHAHRPAPYMDPTYDFANMDVLYSAIVTVAAGTTVDIPVSPNNGTFAGFYYNVVAVDPTTRVSQDDWSTGTPNVPGCPVACEPVGPRLSQYSQRVPESCCGIPIRAFLDESFRNSPLNVPFTNNQDAGDLLVQVEVRGYCCSTKRC